MKKKWILVVTVMVLIITSLVTLIGCGGDSQGDKVVYDAGEYGRIRDGSTDSVVANDGYRFIGWSDPQKQGNKTVYKAQYEYAEYYLSEVKDIYICPLNTFDGLPSLMCKITDMQTLEETIAPAQNACFRGVCSDERANAGGYASNGKVGIDLFTPEFDGILTITIEDLLYSIKQDIPIHIVRNRIVAESIEIIGRASDTSGASGINLIAVDGRCYILYSIFPENTSFPKCKLNILEVFRDGEVLSAEQAQEITYFDEDRHYLYTSDKAKVGDIIRVQASNVRDPEVKSNILSITVY
ncbi:MAG: hypothetical protein K2N23_07990 [Clostridia bacterium]|nr:hypothetical protein [Clostridia bacterium]